MASNPLHRHLTGDGFRTRYPGLHVRSEPDSGEDDDTYTSPIEEWEQKIQDIKSSQTWNNPQDNYGSQPYDGTDTSLLVPSDDPGSHHDDTTPSTNAYTTPSPSATPNATAIIIPILIVVLLLIFLTWFFRASGYHLSTLPILRHRPTTTSTTKVPANTAALASDLEAGALPRVLSPSVPLPRAPARTHDRGWLFMPNGVGLPNWVRGYRRRSDPAHRGEEDWQLDVNEVGEAPPEYSSPVEEKGEADMGVGLQQVTTRGSVLPGYEEGTRAQHEAASGLADRTSCDDGDIGDARQDGDEKNSN